MADEPEKPSGTPEGGDETPRRDLPSWDRSRTKRRRQKEGDEDAFQRGVRRAGRAAVSRSTIIVAALLGVAGMIGLGVWWMGRGVETAAVSTRALATAAAVATRAQLRMEGDPMLDALEQVGREPPIPVVADEAERIAVVEQALADAVAGGDAEVRLLVDLVAAARAGERGDHAEATARYDAFLARAPADHPMGFLAREGRGIALESGGDLEGALAAYEGIAPEVGQFYRDVALFRQARVLERLERRDEAVARYRQYAEEFPLQEPSLAREDVRDRMLEIDPDGLAALAPPDPGPAAGDVEVLEP